MRALGHWVATLRFEGVPAGVRERLLLTLEDTVGVAMAGAHTSELQALREAAPPPTGPARLLGVRGEAAVEHAVRHNGTAACCLELDEGNKVLDLDFEAIADHKRWARALDRAEAELAGAGVRALVNGCSAVDLTEQRAIPAIDPTALALRMLGVLGASGLGAPLPVRAR
ncbi:MAG TPA: MmgE/PrpD family protein [Solirubrobacteraceae bacterium]|nr:MmgE/PrpD family protein [Solirubrobacteraceae bacterium]